MMTEQTMWMVRAGEDAFLIAIFLEKGIIAIGWDKVGDLTNVDNVDTIKERLRVVYPHLKEGQINNFAGQLFRFRFEFQRGQMVITYDPNNRIYKIGEITSEYQYLLDESGYPHTRKINWKSSVRRDDLTTASKNSLGSALTIFKIHHQIVNELLGHEPAQGQVVLPAVEEDSQTLETIKEDIEAKATEFIKDRLTRLDWEEMQDLVAGILRGMGYRTLVSPKGADRGKDIMASPDGLGLEDPRIIVEVKHRTGAMGGPEIRSFLGGLRPNNKGIYVSTGGFTKDAKYEAERSNIPLTLIDLDMIVLLIVQHYDKFDPDTRVLIPLRKIYWPVDI